eukprot:m.158372 g.158372  ORF g.158372 m.158372 type:complete len:410 (+) comp38735_c2_seq1:477-1706(+)
MGEGVGIETEHVISEFTKCRKPTQTRLYVNTGFEARSLSRPNCNRSHRTKPFSLYYQHTNPWRRMNFSSLRVLIIALAIWSSVFVNTNSIALSGASTLCSDSVEKTENVNSTSSCSNRASLRCGLRSRHFEYCNGQSWIAMCPCQKSDVPLKLGTRRNPARSCEEILLAGASVGDGIYWVKPQGAFSYAVYCDMITAGGGWTLISKVLGNNQVMNRLNTAQWRDGRLIGNTTSLSNQNAVGLGYRNMPFHDVMIRSIYDGAKHVAWRHSTTHPSVQKIVQQCKRVADGVKISGDISLLDYLGRPNYHNPCTELVYGFLGGDWKGAATTVAGCSTGTAYHVGAVVGAFLDPPSGDRSLVGQNFKCIADFGLGAGYHKLEQTDDKYSINAHWWQEGNRVTHSWKTHALFVR